MAETTWIRRTAAEASRSMPRRERMSIDLRGHGSALSAIAQSMRMPVAALVRTIVGDWLKTRPATATGSGAVVPTLVVHMPLHGAGAVVKVTLRMPVTQAIHLARKARASEVSQGIYVARLVDALPLVPEPADLKENRAALVRSTAALAALSGDLRALVRMLGQRSSPALEALKAPAGGVADVVDRHLVLAASLMAALTPARRAAFQPDATETKR